jgi:ribA/ribD-fused uncharacterized protein
LKETTKNKLLEEDMCFTILNFRNPKFAFLANDYECDVPCDSITYPSLEHAFQAAKTTDRVIKLAICDADSAREAKKLGRSIDNLIHDWDNKRLHIMEQLLFIKFRLNTDLRSKLLSTGDAELVFQNKINDTFWGVCNGVGTNHLGELLMKARSSLALEEVKDLSEAQSKYLTSFGWVRQPEGDYLWGKCWIKPWNKDEWFSEKDAMDIQGQTVADMQWSDNDPQVVINDWSEKDDE